MPRGNDQDAAIHDLADRYGQGVGDAELLIDANLASQTQALRKAQILPRDEEATAEARKNMDKITGPNGEKVVAVAVRGSVESPERYTVVVVRAEDGRDLTYALDENDEVVTPEFERLGGDSGRSAKPVEVKGTPEVLGAGDDDDDDDESKPASQRRTASKPSSNK